jgi:hypothetical protein
LDKLHAQSQEVQDALEEELGAIECGSAVEQCQEMCVGYCELFGWESREDSKKAMDGTGNKENG